eukprot:7886592-Lingulodinium_polyedra.AAC.1
MEGRVAREPAMGSRILKWHGTQWAKLSQAAKRVYEEQAQALRNMSIAAQGQAIDEVTQKLAAMEEERSRSGQDKVHPPLLFSSAHLSAADIQLWQA